MSYAESYTEVQISEIEPRALLTCDHEVHAGQVVTRAYLETWNLDRCSRVDSPFILWEGPSIEEHMRRTALAPGTYRRRERTRNEVGASAYGGWSAFTVLGPPPDEVEITCASCGREYPLARMGERRGAWWCQRCWERHEKRAEEAA